ncbi:MAG: HAD family hydrolase [Chloroflexota bacterium]|nr:HAD family hydrolase [Anaerolineales bacterium]MCA9974828.1 HAD family hydrolase [Anaerolineales bacterium]MCB8967142.1 HAD family hydrolase [Ardenticatenaceae bacterium]
MTGKAKQIAGVLFDWDLTLAKPTGNISHSERLTMLFQRGGFPCTNEDVVKAIEAHQVGTHENNNTIVAAPQTQKEIIAYYRHLLATLGYTDISWERLAALYHDYAYLPTSLYDDVLPTLRKLRRTGVALGIISNHTPAARGIMQSYLRGFIKPDHIIISDEIGAHKPMPSVFMQAATALDLLPQQCLFVGDNLHVDAIGSVQEGGFQLGLWLDRKHETWDEPLPDGIIRITSLAQVIDFL